ncbi:MAG: hypothetical protein AAGG01_08530, partial [Planctomycetota bacterium]
MPISPFILGCFATLLTPGPPAAGQEVVVKQFDLRHLELALPEKVYSGGEMTLLPLMTSPLGRGFQDRDEYDDPDTVERLVDLFLIENQDQVEAVEVMDGRFVYIESTSEVVARFEAMVDAISAAFAKRPTLEVATVTFPEGVRPDLPQSGRVSRARLQTWIESGAQVSTRAIQPAAWGYQSISDLQAHTVYGGLEVEIAQMSGIFAPQVVDVVTGSSLTLSAHRVGPEVELAYVHSSTERRDIEASEGSRAEVRLFRNGERTEVLDDELWVEPFGVSGGAVMGKARIRRDEFLAITIGGADGTRHCTLVGWTGGDDAGSMVGPLARSQELTSLLLPNGYLRPAHSEIWWSDDRTAPLLETRASDALYDGHWLLRARTNFSDETLLGRRIDMLEVEEQVLLGDYRCLLLSHENATQIQRWVQADVAAQSPQFSVQVSA